jgi:hypothetical protein
MKNEILRIVQTSLLIQGVVVIFHMWPSDSYKRDDLAATSNKLEIEQVIRLDGDLISSPSLLSR